MKNYVFIICLTLAQLLSAQITFVINELPENHDYSESIYISGDFEGWTGGQENFKLKRTDKNYSITLQLDQDMLQYKFTRGTWDTVEKDAEGNNTDNRIYKKSEVQDTVFVKIVRWDKADENSVKQSTAAKNVTILSETFEIPQLDRTRRVWMYLPPDYESSNETYPVLYMHDGQNVFDDLTSYAGEWSVDETLNKLFRLNNFKLIVVAIDNGGDKRMNEYSAWDNQRFGKGEGEAYINFIANTLKPYIDSNFRTKKDAENTGIMGSSMGGLISHYAALKHPDVFGKAGVFSPSFWYAKASYDLVSESSSTENLKMYFLVGVNEGETMVPDMVRMIDLMKNKGFQENNIQQKIVEEGIHNEKFWKNEFEEAIMWLFPNAIKKRAFVNAELNKNKQLEVEVSDGKYIIQFYSSEIVESTFVPKNQTSLIKSHAVVLEPSPINSKLIAKANALTYNSDGISVHIQKDPFKISYYYKGENLLSEQNGYRKIDDLETIQFTLDDDEALFGGGARALGMNRRGHRLQLYNKAHYGYETESELMNYTMPIAISSKQYMLHFDNAPIGYLDLDSRGENTLTYETISGRKTYQVIVGDFWEDLIGNYTELTGKQPMPPRWALGNFSSRFGYHSQGETVETIDRFRDENIPVDAIILDLYWFGKDIQGTMGNLEFYRDSFPNPEQMIKDLKSKKVETILITEPFILTTSKRWEEAVERDILAKDSIGNPATYDFYFGNTGIIDIYNPKGEQWFKNIYKDLSSMGVNGFWGDLGEPEVHPSWVQHATGSADEVHNIYGHDWAKLVYESSLEANPNQRPFILMRAGYSGSQRFGLMPWSGDVNRTWGGLQSQTEIALQMGMQGLAYMHSDLGGFAGANLDDELYTRWLQYGVFQPIYRPHAQEEVPSEPVFREPRTRELAQQSINLRYRLLPYNYTLAHLNSQYGIPLMKPLFFEEPENAELFNNASTYLWGRDFLITPIVNPAVKEKQMYFPKTTVWFDFYTNEKIEGGQTKTILTKEESIPTYVRAGAFIPMIDVIQSTVDYSTSELELHYFHDPSVTESASQLYDDDGLTAEAYEKGLFELLVFNSQFKNNELKFSFRSIVGENYSGKNRQINLVIRNVDEQPQQIRVDGKRVNYKFDKDSRELTVPVAWKKEKALELTIKL